ncbi:MAG: YlxR family protein [Nannocystaceae bacterium]
MSTPIRTCVACRARRPNNALLRVRRSPQGDIVPAVRRRDNAHLQGRSAYLCPTKNCFDRAIKRRSLSRVWSRAKDSPPVQFDDPSRLWSALKESLRTEIEIITRSSREPASLPRVQSLCSLAHALDSASSTSRKGA